MFVANRKPGEIRRVVTGFDSKGISIIQSDSVMEPQSVAPGGNAASTTIWTHRHFPHTGFGLDGWSDTQHSRHGHSITKWYIFSCCCSLFLNEPQNLGTILKFHEMLSGATPMHITKSVDYAVVLEGKIELHLDDGSCTVLRQGEIQPNLTEFVMLKCSRGRRHSKGDVSSLAQSCQW